MRRSLVPLLPAAFLLACASAAPAQRGGATVTNALTDAERAQGWVLLFDGKTTRGWRTFRSAGGGTAGWEVVDGTLARTGPGGDIVTDGIYEDFELQLEWRVSPGGNSGIMFRVSDEPQRTYESGPEMQVLDDERHADGKSRLTSAGANYGLHAAPAGVVKPAGEWNVARLVVRGPHVEHWLNGQKVVEYELGSPDWEAKVKASKFAQWPGYGRSPRGRIALQDHGDPVWYRNIRLRVLP